MYEEELRRILEASEKNALTFFVGAGVSKLSGAPTWGELINEFSDRLGRPRGNYSSEELLQIPQMYWSANKNMSEYLKIIREKLDYSSLVPNNIHHEMLKLLPVSFLTTNYDPLIENAAIQDCKSFKVVSSDGEVPNIYGDRFVLKIHGDLEHGNIVLKEEDYLNYSEKFKMIETLVKSIFATNTVVFIGYSLSDYNIKLILNWTKALLGEKFRKPIFIRSENDVLGNEELRYYEESRGLTVVECIKIIQDDDEKFSEYQTIPDNDKYLFRYQSVFDAIMKLSIDNLKGLTEDEAFENLYQRLRPLDDLQALRIKDVYKKMKPYVSFDADGVIYSHGDGELLLRKFYSIHQMSDGDKAKLSDGFLQKYKTIISVFKKARIYCANSISNELYDLNSLSFADSACITFDYLAMNRYVSRVHVFDANKPNFRKAYYLTKLKRYDEALILFSDIATKAYKEKQYLLYYLAKSNCISLSIAINNQPNVYSYYDRKQIEKHLPSDSEVANLFDLMPVEFRNRYNVFKDVYSSNMLYEFSYGAFVQGGNVQKAIEAGSLEFGLTSSGKAISKLKEYMHFMQQNGIVADIFDEYKSAVRYLLSALVYKYSTYDNEVFHETFPYRNTREFSFDETDFYSLIESFKDNELKQLFRRHNIDSIEFINMDLIEKAVNNIMSYYEYAEEERKKKVEMLSLQVQLKTCLALLEYVSISQNLVDRICAFLFSHEFREINFNDKISFFYSQLRQRGMYSAVTDKVVEDALILYLDRQIDRLINKTNDVISPEKIPSGYYKLIYFLSSERKENIARKLSKRVVQIMEQRLKLMYKQIAWDYCDYITEAQRKRLVSWAREEIISDFHYQLFAMLINYHGEIGVNEIEKLKVYLWSKIQKTTDSSSVTHIVHHFPEDNPYEELEQVGIWCFTKKLDRKEFAEFCGYSDFFDFFYEYSNYDFRRFDVSWLVKYLPKPLLKEIAKDDKVRGKIREAIAVKLKIAKIDEYDKKKLQEILVDYFCYS